LYVSPYSKEHSIKVTTFFTEKKEKKDGTSDLTDTYRRRRICVGESDAAEAQK